MKDRLRDLYYSIILLGMNIVWLSPWGRAIIHKTVNLYLNSPLFSERAKIFGKIEAAKMFSYQEYRFFRQKVFVDLIFLLSLFPYPYFALRDLEEKNLPYCRYMKV